MKYKLLLLTLFCFGINNISAQEYMNKHWRLSVGGGYSFMTANTKHIQNNLVSAGLTAKDAKSLANGLKKGPDLSLKAIYMFNPFMGLGAKYNYFSTGHNMKNIHLGVDASDKEILGNLKSDASYNFIGASYFVRIPFGYYSRFSFYSQFSLGYLHYNNKVKSLSNTTLSGGSFGMNCELGFECRIHPNWGVGVSADSTAGSLRKVTVKSNGTSEKVKLSGKDKVKMTRIGAMLGIHLYL